MPTPFSLHIDPRMAAYGFSHGGAPGGRHPIGADRFAAFFKSFLAAGLDRDVEIVAASPKASHGELSLFHTAAYLDFVRTRCAEGTGMLDAGTVPAERGLDIAAAAVTGSVLHAARRILNGETRRAMVPIAGFAQARSDAAHDGAIYNDPAILIRFLQETRPGSRIAYIDLDAHYPAAVFESFASDDTVALLDIHQDAGSFWSMSQPAEERGSVRGETAWSEMMRAGAGDSAFEAVWPDMRRWLDDRRPDVVIFTAGPSSLRDDGLAGLTFTPAVHRTVARDLGALADRTAQGRLIVLGGGGYALDNLGRCWCPVIETLKAGPAPSAPGATVSP